MHVEAKVAIVRSGKKMYEIANELGWSQSRLSQIINGVFSPTPDERKALAEKLGRPAYELFGAKKSGVA